MESGHALPRYLPFAFPRLCDGHWALYYVEDRVELDGSLRGGDGRRRKDSRVAKLGWSRDIVSDMLKPL